MKKIIIVTLVALASMFLVSCGTSRVTDLRALSLGMSKAEVVQAVGLADRTLAINSTDNGLQEILEFRTYYNEVYAVEFLNDRMVGYEFLYEDSPSVITGTVVPLYPVGGRPIYHVQPNRPTYPNRPNRPNRPTIPNRPTKPIERPTQPSRPNNDMGTTRPLDKNDGGTTTTRPSTRPSTREAGSTR